MPITENTFTPEELTSALTANKDALLPIVKSVLGNGFKFTIQDETEHNSFKQNFEADVIARKTSEWAQNLEKDVKELTGIEKESANEKYYDYFKRATKAKLDSVTRLEAELATLKDKSNPSEADKKRIQQLEAGIQEKETTYKAQLQEKDGIIHSLKVGNELQSALAKLRANYKADIPASIVEIVENTAIQQLTKSAKFQEDNKLTFLNDKGEVIVNPANYQPQTAEALLKDMLKDLIDAGRTATGTGTGNNSQQQQQQGQTGPITAIPADVTTKVLLTAYLLKQGLTQGSKEFDEAFNKFGANLPLR